VFLKKFRLLSRACKREFRMCQLVLRDPRTPRVAKFLLGLAVGYVLLPFDLIPDFIPVLGCLDDVVIVPGLVWLALKLTPDEIVAEYRQEACAAIGSGSLRSSVGTIVRSDRA
jgi:uncharacterized membrane protein YkvA (DUF1232 family)